MLDGLDELRRYYLNRPRLNGKMISHFMTNPVIEVAGNGETAKGFWLAVGNECTPYTTCPNVVDDGDPVGPRTIGPDKYGLHKFCHWVWNRYGMDFIKEDGQWRLWHLRTVGFIRSHFDMDWVDFYLINRYDDQRCGLAIPIDQPSTPLYAFPTRNSPVPHPGYSLEYPPIEAPAMPEPYNDIADTFEY